MLGISMDEETFDIARQKHTAQLPLLLQPLLHLVGLFVGAKEDHRALSKERAFDVSADNAQSKILWGRQWHQDRTCLLGDLTCMIRVLDQFLCFFFRMPR